MRRRRPGVDLVQRLRPYMDPSLAPERMVSADPIRMFLYRWMIETGDPIEVVAKGFDVDLDQARQLLSGSIRAVGAAEATDLRTRLGLDEEDVASDDRLI